jgi:hypothetical protein
MQNESTKPLGKVIRIDESEIRGRRYTALIPITRISRRTLPRLTGQPARTCCSEAHRVQHFVLRKQLHIEPAQFV